MSCRVWGSESPCQSSPLFIRVFQAMHASMLPAMMWWELLWSWCPFMAIEQWPSKGNFKFSSSKSVSLTLRWKSAGCFWDEWRLHGALREFPAFPFAYTREQSNSGSASLTLTGSRPGNWRFVPLTLPPPFPSLMPADLPQSPKGQRKLLPLTRSLSLPSQYDIYSVMGLSIN